MNTTIKQLLSTIMLFGCLSLTHTASAAIYVENLPTNTTENQLIELFSAHGQVMKVSLSKNEGDASSSSAFVHMGNFAAEQAALKGLQNQPVNGQAIKLKKATPRAYEYGVIVP